MRISSSRRAREGSQGIPGDLSTDGVPRSVACSTTRVARRGSPAIAQALEDLFGLRIAARLVLREDQLAVEDDVEDAAVAANQLGDDAGLPFDLGRQTGGPGEIVSTSAVGEGDLHFRSSCRRDVEDIILRTLPSGSRK
jgi:hypothetical protein